MLILCLSIWLSAYQIYQIHFIHKLHRSFLLKSRLWMGSIAWSSLRSSWNFRISKSTFFIFSGEKQTWLTWSKFLSKWRLSPQDLSPPITLTVSRSMIRFRSQYHQIRKYKSCCVFIWVHKNIHSHCFPKIYWIHMINFVRMRTQLTL